MLISTGIFTKRVDSVEPTVNPQQETGMREEYSFNLTVPAEDVDRVQALLEEAKVKTGDMRISRKPDRGGKARYYLSFSLTGARMDLAFHKWFAKRAEPTWDLFGPHYGRWGFTEPT